LARVIGLLSDPSARVVTLCGRGGVGKTRLALELARRFAAGSRCRVAAVALAGVRDPTLVIPAIAPALGIAFVPGSSVEEAVARQLGSDEVLLVLDNLEHLLASAGALADLVDKCPRLQLLATSQAPLRLPHEHVVEVRPLPVPEPVAQVEDIDLPEFGRQPAVALYCERAAAVNARFALSSANAAAIGELCRRLDGLPLAIELAAARAPELPASEIVARLELRPLDVLRQPGPSTLARQHGLRATIDWTYRLLGEDDQRLLRNLSVVEGPFDFDTVEALSGATPVEALEQLSTLVDFHIVEPLPGPGVAYFVIPDAIRAFADHELRATAERGHARRRHVACRAEAVSAALVGMETAEEGKWRSSLFAAHEDLLGSLNSAVDLGLVDESLHIASGLAVYCNDQGYHQAHERLLDRVLALASTAPHGAPSPAAHGEVLLWGGLLGLRQRPGERSGEMVGRLQKGEELARASGDEVALLRALSFWVLAMPFTRDVQKAAAAAKEGLWLAERTGRQRWQGRFEAWSGMLAHQTGDDKGAVALGCAAMRRARRHGDSRTVVVTTMLLEPLVAKFPEAAAELPSAAEALALARANGLFVFEVPLLAILAAQAVADGDAAGATVWCLEGLTLARSFPGSHLVGFNLVAAMEVAALRGDHGVAAYFHGVLADLYPALEAHSAPERVASHAETVRVVRDALGPELFDAEESRGKTVPVALGVQEAIDYLRKGAEDFATTTVPDPSPAGSSDDRELTARQREVLRLLATGLTNKEISERLHMAPKTVMHHLTAVYQKLGVRSRSEATAWAFRAALVI
jgi:predicted ATPase/DNA-binding CsgD family transcriptional regulator